MASDVTSAKVICNRNELFQQHSETTSGECFNHIETSQLVRVKNQLTGFNTMG